MKKTIDREVREKLIVSGTGSLSDAELIAVVIREGTEALSAVELAEKILADFGNGSAETSPGSLPGAGSGVLSELAGASVQRIRRAAGCGTVRDAVIAAACELARRITAEKALAVNTVSSKEDVEKLFAPLADLPHEEFWVVYLTSGGKVIDRTRLSQGGVSGTVVDHKLVVKRAVELLASSLILVHNHPSGIARPSRDDVAVTESISTAAALFDIKVIDHVIISKTGSYSFAESGQVTRTV